MWAVRPLGWGARCLKAATVRVSSQGERLVGTSTWNWRARQDALGLGVLSVVAPSRHVALPELTADVDDIVRKAHTAAAGGEADACLRLLWNLKDIPQRRTVCCAVNAPAGSPARTLLQVVAEAGLDEPARLLLELAPSVDFKGEDGKTALHLAAEGNHAVVAQDLLARGRANVDARDAEGRTPLHLAANRGHARVGRVLMRFGADPSAPDRAGMTPLVAAEAYPESPPGGLRGGFAPWLEQFAAKRRRWNENCGKVPYYKAEEAGGAELPAHIKANRLVRGAIGYYPVEDGEVKILKRPIRFRKRRQAPSMPSCKVNWYSPRG